jgi:hypothetical protein
MSANTVSAKRGTDAYGRGSTTGYRPGQSTAAAGRAILAPVMRAWYRRGLNANAFVPRPERTTAHVCGPRPVRVLILGGAGPAIGWGVRCPELALPGQLARSLAEATGRGVDVRVVADHELALAGAMSALTGQDLNVNAVVVVTGMREAVSLRSARAWHRNMATLIHGLKDACPTSAHVVVAGMQPVPSIPVFRAAGLSSLADRHADRLNALTRELCASEERVAFTRLPAPSAPTENRYRSPADYREWADVLTVALADDLPALEDSSSNARHGQGQNAMGPGAEPRAHRCESPDCPAGSSNRAG